jgi:hypothetical protein
MPSDTVEDLARQEKPNHAIQLYPREGATRMDINPVNTSDSMATDSGISRELALEKTLRTPTVEASSRVTPGDEAVGNAGVGCLWPVLSFFLALILFVASAQAMYAWELGGGEGSPPPELLLQIGLTVAAFASGILGTIVVFTRAWRGWRARRAKEATERGKAAR